MNQWLNMSKDQRKKSYERYQVETSIRKKSLLEEIRKEYTSIKNDRTYKGKPPFSPL